MDRPHLSWAVPLVLTTPLLVSGGIVIHASLAWTIRSEVGLAAETVDGVSFFVWIPRPSQAMRVAAVTPDAAYDLVETPFGTMGNLSGVRFASVRYEWDRPFFGEMPWSGEWGVPLVPAEASGYRVYRSSSDPNTWMVVTADTGWSGTRLGAWAGCHGEGFQADVRDGWNTIASRSGTCVGGAGGLLTPALSVPFFAAAGILVIVAWRKSPRFRV